jgi:serine protease Do
MDDRGLADAARRALRAVAGSVVRIGRDGGRGCGIVTAPGVVVTNAHNLRDTTTEVTFADGRRAQGEVAGADPDTDLAVVRVDTADVAPVRWAERRPEPGDVVFAVALGPWGGPRVSAGMVSAVGRSFRGPRGRPIADAVEHTAPLARGSSGSPLVDGGGAVVGLNTHRLGDGFYLAQPAAEVRARAGDLARGEVPRRRRLGVALAPPHVARRMRQAVGLDPREGLLVRHVEPGGPAAAAGLRPGDLIVEAGGEPVATVEDLFAVLDAPGGTTLALRIVRGVEELDLTVRWDGGAGPGPGS